MITKHTCNGGGGPVFGRKTPGCPRCDELINGAAPVVWGGTLRTAEDARRRQQMRDHDCVARRCGAVCTAFDW